MFIIIIFHVWISYYFKKYDEKCSEQSNKRDCNATSVDNSLNSAAAPLNSDKAKSDGICSKCNLNLPDDFYLTDPNVMMHILRILVPIVTFISGLPFMVYWFYY